MVPAYPGIREEILMADTRILTRRAFTIEAALALLAGAAITVSGCYGGNNSSPTSPSLQPGDVQGSISANHGHTAIIRAAQLQAGNAVTLTLTTGSGHSHSLTLSQAQVMSIGSGSQVSQESSSTEAHTHIVTFN